MIDPLLLIERTIGEFFTTKVASIATTILGQNLVCLRGYKTRIAVADVKILRVVERHV